MTQPAANKDRRWLNAAAALALRARPSCRPNPAVGAILVSEGKLISRGWTQPGGRPHAEAIALIAAGERAAGATLYTTLEPCAHVSARGPDCAGLIVKAKPARVVIGQIDPDSRTTGAGIRKIQSAGICVDIIACEAVRNGLQGYLFARQHNRARVTLKLATSIDGCIALANGESQWITGDAARAHAHAIRARMDAILVGGATLRTDSPRLDVRLSGLEAYRPERWVLTRQKAPAGWRAISSPQDIVGIDDVHDLLVEGGAQTAAAFLSSDLVDRLLVYRAPIIIGGGLPSVTDIGLEALNNAHGRWSMTRQLQLGRDVLEVYTRTRCLPE